MEGVFRMTNTAAIGYMIIAARELKLDEKTIRDLASKMIRAMDTYSEEEAEKVNEGA